MSLFGNSIGQMMINVEDDVFKAKDIFGEIGLYEREPDNGILDKELDSALKVFQKEKGLKIDGLLHPDGDTEQAVIMELGRQTHEQAPQRGWIVDHQKKPKDPLLVLRETLEKSRPKTQNQSPLELLLGNLEALEKTPDVIKTLQEKQVPKPEDKPAPVDATGRMMRDEIPPVPDRKPEIEKKPRQQDMPDNFDEIADFVKKQEGAVDHLYKDTGGNMTVGVGHLITNVEEAKKLPFYMHDENDKPVRPATPKEIETLYGQIKKIPHGQGVGSSVYNPQTIPKMKDIKLREQDRDQLFKKDLEQRVKELRQNWPEFDDVPPKMKIALMDIHFNIGAGNFKPAQWKEFKKALDAKDWKKAAKESHRDTPHEGRNDKTRDKILEIIEDEQEQ